ncbi:MAG: PD-(D/E)XK nuclease family protein [Lactobacillus sp.]
MINLLTGQQTAPLSEAMIKSTVEHYLKNKQAQTFLIVPNHLKFTTEVQTLKVLARLGHGARAVKNLHIFSFSRLAWLFLRDADVPELPVLDDSAAQMLLRQIFSKKQADLHLFKGKEITDGLLAQVYDALLALKDSDVDLAALSTNAADQESRAKFHDLKVIGDEFAQQTAGKFITKADRILQLNQYLAGQDLTTMSFYFTGFSHFSWSELTTLKLLFAKAANVTVALATANGKAAGQFEPGDYDYVVQRTINQLTTFCHSRGLPFNEKELPNLQTPAASLNRLWRSQPLPNDRAQLQASQFVQLVQADSRYAEAYFAAHTIYQQVALRKNLRYQDFLILAPDLHEYETYLLPILRQNGIPYFNDLQREMKYHPLVVLVESLAGLLQEGLTTSKILALLKTQLLVPASYATSADFRHDVDLLENFVLAHGLDHELWQRPLADFTGAKLLHVDGNDRVIARLDGLRAWLIARLDKLTDDLTKTTDPQAGCRTFFEFLTNNGVSSVLTAWRQRAQDSGQLQLAQEPEQVWNLLCQLLKDYLQIAAKFDLAAFFSVLQSGFSKADFATIPSTLDAVNVSELGMVQRKGYRQVFILGATNTSLPKIDKTPGFLSSENLAAVAGSFDDSHYLEDRQKITNLDQNYQFGAALALATDKVYLSYPVLNPENERLSPSLYYTRLRNWDCSEFLQHDLPAADGQDMLNFVTTPQASLGYSAYNQNQALLDLEKKFLGSQVDQVLTSAQFDNQPEDLQPATARRLYGRVLTSSVSQLETYYENSFEYFLNYGLKLRPRAENELDAIQAGNYFHQNLDHLVKYLQKNKLALTDLSQPELAVLMQKIGAGLQETKRYQQLLHEPFNRYLFSVLDQTVGQLARNWRARAEHTALKSAYSELSFGPGQKLPGLSFTLPAGRRIDLEGKIDRVDLARANEAALGQVIDYKSSAKSFEPGKFAAGLTLQMVSYLDVLAKHPSFFAGTLPLKLLGAFYQTVTQKLVKLNKADSFGSNFQAKFALAASEKQLMYKGIMVVNQQALAAADQAVAAKENSHFYAGLSKKKDGQFSMGRSLSFSPAELDLLLAYDELLVKQAANQILSGQITLNPFRAGQQNQLAYSNYRDIYFFDPLLPQNSYHEIGSLHKQDLLILIKNKLKEARDNGATNS